MGVVVLVVPLVRPVHRLGLRRLCLPGRDARADAGRGGGILVRHCGVRQRDGAGGEALARPVVLDQGLGVGEVLEPVADLLQRRAVLGGGGERLLDQRPHLRVEAREVVLAAAHAVHDRHGRPAAERRAAGAGVGHRRGPGVHVGGGRGVVAVEDLGGEVARGAEQPAVHGDAGVLGDAGEAEVDQDRGAPLHDHVGRLDVAVQDADGVDGLDGLGEAVGEPQEVVAGERALLLHVVVQREAGDVAGGDVGDLAPRIGVDDLGDAAAADPGQRADLAGQPTAGLVVTDDVRAQHLDRDGPLPRLLPEVHHAHAALAEAGTQRVAAHGQTRRRRLRGRRHAHEDTAGGPRSPSSGALSP